MLEGTTGLSPAPSSNDRPAQQAFGTAADLAVLNSLDQAAAHATTPCGPGKMVWRSWGEGPALVLLHGGSGSWRHWVKTIPAFASSRRVLAPDHPGLGESDLPPAPYSPSSIAAIIARGVEALLAPG
ncbi:MAG: alpha/beta fold hydrolase [Acetobacteraceae bacterium]